VGMLDEIYCEVPLPDGRDPSGACFQTKSFPDPGMCCYRITSAGRLVDSDGNDLEADGFVTFYTVDWDDDAGERSSRNPSLREYRAQFSSGQLENVARVEEDAGERVCYGLASFRRFEPPALPF
jgi:hypothetical protein